MKSLEEKIQECASEIICLQGEVVRIQVRLGDLWNKVSSIASDTLDDHLKKVKSKKQK